MHFSAISVLALIGSAVAAPAILTSRDDTVVRYNIKRISDALTSLDGQLGKKPRSSADARTVNTFVNNILRIQTSVTREMRDGASDLRHSKGTVSTTEVLSLQPTMLSNDRLSSEVASKYIDIKRQVTSARRTNEVLESLISAQTELNNFSDALIATLPSLSQSLGQGMKTRFNNNLSRAISEYRRP